MTKHIDLDIEGNDPELIVVEHTGTLEEFQVQMAELHRRALLDSVATLRVRILELETEIREVMREVRRHAAK
jgi:hypothetical protein